MGVIFGILLACICLVSLYAYLKVVYQCVRRVRIVKAAATTTSSSSNNSSSSNSTSNAKAATSNTTTAPATATTTTAKEPTNGSGIFTLAVSDATMPLSPETIIRVEEFEQAPGPLPWPILGNLDLLGRYPAPFQAFSALAKRFGDVYTLTLGSTRCLIVNNLELIREVLNQNGKYFGGRPDFQRFHVLFGGDRNNSLALCDWSQLQQKRRNLARKHCSPRDSTSYFHKMSSVGCAEMLEFMQRLRQTVPSGREFALKPIVQQTCANMFCQYMCSTRFDYDDTEFQYIVRCFDEIFWEINQGYAVDFLPWLSPFYAGHMKRIVHWSTTIREFILNRIINVRERNFDIDEPADFTDALLKSLAENEDVSRDTIIFMLEDFVGGHSAIGNLVMLALAYIVLYPATGTRIQAEIDGIIGQSARNVTLMDTNRMPYTVATIYEVLRYSSSPIVPHVATEDVAIAGYGVTKGTIVFINNYELNTSTKYWHKPEQFDPARFLERRPVTPAASKPANDTKTNKDDSESEAGAVGEWQLRKNIPHFLPFSIGKRTCIGQNLVKGFGFIMLANIMHKYDVSCSDVASIKAHIKTACVAVPPDTFLLALTPRQRTD